MRIRNDRWNNKIENPGDLETLARLADRVRRLRLLQLSHSPDPVAASVALLAASVDRLIFELRQLERRS